MNAYRPLDCDLHDYLEIACLYGYRLQVEWLDGPSFDARALTTRTSAQQEEFLCLQGAQGERAIRLDRLRAITPLDPGSRFGRIELAGHFCPL
ncbi:MAG: Rho-binding antiterminator [Pseudomonas sp.]|uniref:Rho-binding antiterminator n=1 Tax=Pseudomonas sp. TaxID=306 RepID=UPI00339708C8